MPGPALFDFGQNLDNAPPGPSAFVLPDLFRLDLDSKRLPDGTIIKRGSTGLTMVYWPDGRVFCRTPDGRVVEYLPDGRSIESRPFRVGLGPVKGPARPPRVEVDPVEWRSLWDAYQFDGANPSLEGIPIP